MTLLNKEIGRRKFLKNSSLASGSLVLGFNWLVSCKSERAEAITGIQMPEEWYEINGFLKIGENGVVTIMSPNPEIGQNVKTSMPMIVAEELDVSWDIVVVEQAPLNTDVFTRQLAGGSQSIRQGWESLRKTGATARQMLKQAAANEWAVPVSEVETSQGKIFHKASNKSAGYGEMAASASKVEIPEEVELKKITEFNIIGTSTKNVDGKKIVTGQPLYGLDTYREGMQIAMIIHPPKFGMKLKSFDATEAKRMPGITDVMEIDSYNDEQTLTIFDTSAFTKLVAVVGESTWQCMEAKKAVKCEWEMAPASTKELDLFGNPTVVKHPAGLESSETHINQMLELSSKKANVVRRDGNPEAAFANADRIIESTYTCPFLAHNPMEPMNFFADVQDDRADLVGPIQTPEFMEMSLEERLGIPKDKIDIMMTRQGGGFGRRLYGHFMLEAAVISKKLKKPIKLVYTREDDLTHGTYRPSYLATYRAALDKDNNLLAFHVRAGGIPEPPLMANRFPAGAIDNYLAEDWTIDSNITTGAFRAPRSNFIAGAEQSFLDELAEAMGKDPIDFRLELLEKANNSPIGENNDYEAERYAEVLKLVKEKSKWTQNQEGLFRGVSAYYCHNSYVAQVLDLVEEQGKPTIQKVYCAIDCGIVVNPDAAINLAEGGIVDGIGHAMYSSVTFKEGNPEQKNFDKYRLIRHKEAPKDIEVHFVDNQKDPTGLGEPPFPPIIGALANALYKATGKRHYHQPFIDNKDPFVG